jgi:glycosyltransferase involved in cell wall biosynthesis
VSVTGYDVAILCDFRYPGGTSTSIAEEVRAQAAAGLSTVLVHVPSPHQPTARPFSPRILDCIRDGAADLAHDGEPVHAKVLLIKQPRIFTEDLAVAPRVHAGRTVMVLNQAPGDLTDAQRYYDVAALTERVERYFGAVEWTPISPQIRGQILRVAPDAVLAAEDWHEIIDVDHWWLDRPEPVGPLPVIGRHGRADAVKWPREAAEILAAYPAADDLRVRVLGGGELAVKRIGHQPASWEVLPFGELSPRAFLRTIDFFVYFHDKDLVEAFGRTILEAMASGVPVIVGEHFRPLFGDAAHYCTPAEAPDLARALYADWPRYRASVAKARQIVEERFGHSSHLARLGVSPARVEVPAPRPAVRALPPRTPRVLMVSDNGAGLGHLSRLMAMARRFPDGLKAVIATQSHGASVAYGEGFLTEYVPSRKVLRMDKPKWSVFLRARLKHLIDVYQPTVVAVDSVPHDGFLDAIADHPGVTWVWVRRAMWRKGVGTDWIERGPAFDAILEPGEYAAAADEGPTVADRARVHAVEPITFLDAAELLDAAAARTALGVDDRPTALLQLGAGNINDISSPVNRSAGLLQKHGFQVVVAESTIATGPVPRPVGAQAVKIYPVSRYLRGFDLVVAASGYNSFHELIGFGVPSVFVPNRATGLDDQVARARYAAATGTALVVEDPESDELEAVLDRAARADVRAALSRRCADVTFGNGAGPAATWLGSLTKVAVGG